ncbi:MAG: hypothetical protein V1644_01845 [Candidatus Micrarchaeota archaeon]
MLSELSELSDFILGAVTGLTGLIPFIHANTIIQLTNNVSFTSFDLFAVALVFTRVSFEMLASTKFELSSEANAIALESIHELKKTSSEKTILKTMLKHSLLAMLLSLLLYPLFSTYGKSIQTIVSPAIPVFLIGIFAWFILSQKNKNNLVIISALAGLCGIVVLEKNLQNSLFILLTGLYTLPTLLASNSTPANEPAIQTQTNNAPTSKSIVITGSLIGMTSAFFPAMTPTMLAVTALCFLEKQQPLNFITLNASIIGSRTVSDFAALEFLGKGRSGATATMLEDSTYNFTTIYTYLIIGIILACLAAFTALKIHKFIPTNIMNKWTKAVAAIAIFTYVFYTSSVIGVIALVACSLVGLTCVVFKVGRSTLGSAILFPSFKNYLN